MIQLPFPIRFDYYLKTAETWQEILTPYILPDTKQITELCCGWAPKVFLGAVRAGFTGTYTAIDKSRDHTDLFRHLASYIPYPGKLKTKTLDILSSPIPKSDIIVMNHGIDDLLLSDFASDQHLDMLTFFHAPESLEGVWNAIAEKTNVEEWSDRLYRLFSQSMKIDSLACIYQYAGYQEKLYRTSTSFVLTSLILKTLCDTIRNKKEHVICDNGSLLLWKKR